MAKDELVVRNEFAAASLRLVKAAGATQVIVEDLETHRTVALDALMVASLPWADDETWDGIVDPAVRTPED